MQQNLTLRKVLVWSLCAIYLVLSMGLVLLGSSLYHTISQNAEETYTHRTSFGYIQTQLRRGDSQDAISLVPFGEQYALCMTEGEYTTYFYYYEGYLRELYTYQNSDLVAADGIPILPIDSLTFSAHENYIDYTINGLSSRYFYIGRAHV